MAEFVDDKVKYAFELNCLYVDNIPNFVSKADMTEVFEPFGQMVNVRVFIKRENDPQSVQYGFVNFANSADAERARISLNGKEIYGRKWNVYPSERKKTIKNDKVEWTNACFIDLSAPSVHVSFISSQLEKIVTEDTLRGIFNRFGIVSGITIKKSSIDEKTRTQSGYGFVYYSKEANGMGATLDAVETLFNHIINDVQYSCRISKAFQKRYLAMNPDEQGMMGQAMRNPDRVQQPQQTKSNPTPKQLQQVPQQQQQLMRTSSSGSGGMSGMVPVQGGGRGSPYPAGGLMPSDSWFGSGSMYGSGSTDASQDSLPLQQYYRKGKDQGVPRSTSTGSRDSGPQRGARRTFSQGSLGSSSAGGGSHSFDEYEPHYGSSSSSYVISPPLGSHTYDTTSAYTTSEDSTANINSTLTGDSAEWVDSMASLSLHGGPSFDAEDETAPPHHGPSHGHQSSYAPNYNKNYYGRQQHHHHQQQQPPQLQQQGYGSYGHGGMHPGGVHYAPPGGYHGGGLHHMSHPNNYTQPMHAPQHNPNLHYRPNRNGASVGPPGSGPPARSGPSISQKGLQSQQYQYRGQGYGESSARDRDTPLGAPGGYSQADLVLKYSGDDEEESPSSFSSLSNPNPNPAGAGSRRSVGNYGGLRDHGALTITAPRPPLASGGGPASNGSISSADGSRTESPLNVPLRISPGLKIDVPIPPGGLGSGGLDNSSHNSESSIGSLGQVQGQSQGQSQGQGQGQGQSYQSYHY